MNGSFRFNGIFWRFFFGFWLTIAVVTGLAWTVSADWQQVPENWGSIERGPGAHRAIHHAVGVARWSGSDALVHWLQDAEINRRPEVFAVDSRGRELSGRTVPEGALKELATTPAVSGPLVRQNRHRRMHRDMGGDMGMGSGVSRRVPEFETFNESGVVQMDIAPWGPVKLFAVRTDVPKRPLIAGLWRTPWWVFIVLMLAVTTVVAWALAWRYSKPVRTLNRAMQRAAEGDFSTRVTADIGHDRTEIGELALQYDAMAEKINGLLTRQKRLFHDVSHELRSPLARIDVAIALAQRNPERSREVLGRIEREVSLLDRLVDELLTYARLDDNAPMRFEVVDIVGLVEGVVDDAAFEGSARGIAVTLEVPDAVIVNAHIESLMSALENLIRNALRFSTRDQTVAVAIADAGQHWRITVTDQGPGIDPEELGGLFSPFVRGKSQATGGGFGLGLAIAKRAVERHGGTLSAVNVKPHGLQMIVVLPKVKAGVPAAA